MQDIIRYFTDLPPFGLAIIAIFLVGIVFAIFRKLIKFAITLAALIIMVLVIIRLLQH